MTLQDGRYCKSGDKTRLYLGTFYTTSTTATEDSGGGTTTQVGGKRFLWNYFNRVPSYARVHDTTATWSYLTATWRQANAAAGNKVEFVVGIAEDAIHVAAEGVCNSASNTTASTTSVGADSTTTPGIHFGYLYVSGGGANQVSPTALETRIPAAGYRFFAWLERGGTAGTSLWLGAGAGMDALYTR